LTQAFLGQTACRWLARSVPQPARGSGTYPAPLHREQRHLDLAPGAPARPCRGNPLSVRCTTVSRGVPAPLRGGPDRPVQDVSDVFMEMDGAELSIRWSTRATSPPPTGPSSPFGYGEGETGMSEATQEAQC